MPPAASQRDARAAPSGVDPRIHSAVTDLYTYVLLVDAERTRLTARIEELTLARSTSGETFGLAERRMEMAEELEALRAAVSALQRDADAIREGGGPTPTRAGPRAQLPGSGSPPAA